MLLQRRTFFVKERVAVLRLTDTYDILDPESKQKVGVAKEEPPLWAKLLRFVFKKALLPTVIRVYEAEGTPAQLELRKKHGFLRTTVQVHQGARGPIGRFRSKLFSLGGGFDIFDEAGHRIGEVKGDWKGWNFRFLDPRGQEIGVVTKKWAGIGRELFTSADNYMIALHDQAATSPEQGPLLLAAGLAIDIVYKEAA